VTRIAVLGATGRMGRMVLAAVLAAEDLQLVAAIGHSRDLGIDAGALIGLPPAGVAITALAELDADVVIDFSLPEALAAALPRLGKAALVTGTTGKTPDLSARANAFPVLQAANFSTGVNVLLHVAAEVAAAMPAADVEIVEAHHRLKQDAPSGTALALGDAIARARASSLADHAVHGRSGRPGPRPAGEIGFHALRLGDVVGEHQVWFAADGERVSLGHVASSRATFAAGALRAARWIAGRPAGTYAMADVLGLRG
jgi:4-hydroxy-tetrahydrodipicolinate reductase